MIILAQRVGGSGHTSRNLHRDFAAGHIPFSWAGQPLVQATLNLILQVGSYFRTPADGAATTQYVAANKETYYLQEIRLRVIKPSASQWVSGVIHRNRPHPPEFDNVIEVVAPDLSRFLTADRKEWFEVDGPFESLQRPTSP